MNPKESLHPPLSKAKILHPRHGTMDAENGDEGWVSGVKNLGPGAFEAQGRFRPEHDPEMENARSLHVLYKWVMLNEGL